MMASSAAASAERQPKEKAPMTQALPIETFKAGTVIMREGDAPGAVYIIAKGKIKVTKAGRTLAEMGRDGIFGDMALIDNSPRSATVTAVDDTDCFVISVDEFKKILVTAHPLLQAITKILTGRLRQMTSMYHSN